MEHSSGEDDAVTDHRHLHELRVLTLFAGIVVTLLISIALMNIFIAIMCVAYERAERHATRQFFRERSRAVLTSMATVQGWRMLCCLQRKRQESRIGSTAGGSDKFVWYVVSELEGADDFGQSREHSRDHSDMHPWKSKEDIQRLQEQSAQHSQQLQDISAQLREIQSGLSKLGELGARAGKPKKKRRDSVPAGTSLGLKSLDSLDYVFDRTGQLDAANFVNHRNDEYVRSPSPSQNSRHQAWNQVEMVTQQQALDLELAGQTIAPQSPYGLPLRQAGLAGSPAVASAGLSPPESTAVRHLGQRDVNSPRVVAAPRPSQPLDPGDMLAKQRLQNLQLSPSSEQRLPKPPGGTSAAAPSELPRLVHSAGSSPTTLSVNAQPLSTLLQPTSASVASYDLRAPRFAPPPTDEDGWRKCSNGIAALRQRWANQDAAPIASLIPPVSEHRSHG